MGTLVNTLQLGPSLSQMGCTNSQVLDPFCWRVSMLGYSSFASTAAETCLLVGKCSPTRAQFQPYACDSWRGSKIFSFKDGHMLLIRHRMSRGHYQGDMVVSGKSKIRSFVDEVTAHSTDMEDLSASDMEEWQVGVASEEDLEANAVRDSDYDVAAFDTGLDEMSYNEQDDWNDMGSEYDSGIQLKEAERLPSLSRDEHFADIQFGGHQQNWTKEELKEVEKLRNFEQQQENNGGLFVVQAMRVEHMKATENLLVDSFAELMGGLLTYRPLLALTVRQYVLDRSACLPNAVTLVGLYAPPPDENAQFDEAERKFRGNSLLTGTVELSFGSNGRHPEIPAGPAPPPDAPYLCNMAVSSKFRRQGLGRQLLKAAEDLAVLMGAEELYLHCRMIDIAPLNMYQRAGYKIVATDSILSLLSFQRRRHLMHKRLLEPAVIT